MWTGALRPGVVVDRRYRLRERLGGGGMAAVWRAEDLDERRFVALKLLHPRHRVDSHARDRLRREARLLIGFDHPNLARAYRVRLDHQEPYLVLELIDGETLESEIGDRAEVGHHFSSAEILSISEQLVAAVTYAHQRSVIHRDLKPSNVMLARGQVKILDFGIAKILQDAAEGAAATTCGRILGSSFYMAPEQASGREVDARTDIFSLGVILFEMLTLRRAWVKNARGGPVRAFAEPARANEFNAPGAIVDRICKAPRPRPTVFRSTLPRAVDRVIMRAMDADPLARHAHAIDLHAGLVRAFQDAPAVAAFAAAQFDRAEAATVAVVAPGTTMEVPTAVRLEPRRGSPVDPASQFEAAFDAVPASRRYRGASSRSRERAFAAAFDAVPPSTLSTLVPPVRSPVTKAWAVGDHGDQTVSLPTIICEELSPSPAARSGTTGSIFDRGPTVSFKMPVTRWGRWRVIALVLVGIALGVVAANLWVRAPEAGVPSSGASSTVRR